MPWTPGVRGRAKLSFSRDVRLFFGALVGFLTFLIILLLLLLQSFLDHAREASMHSWENLATLTVEVINETNLLSDPSSLEARLTILQARYGIAGIKVDTPGRASTVIGVPPTEESVESIVRDVHGGRVTVVFDASRLRGIERTFTAIAAICLGASVMVVLLLGLYLPKITRPVEEMLSAASELEERLPGHDEQEYLTETFRNSIATLKRQEGELRQMHDAQKSRADDLERVTAALTRSLTSGFVAVDPEANVVEVNAAGRQIIRPIAEPAGLPVETAFGSNAFSTAIRQAVEKRLAMTRVELQLDEAADSRVIGLTTAPLLSDDQKFVGLLALFTDLTPVRMLEGRVRDLQTLADLGQISAGIAHEFRNSLATMLGYLRLARREDLSERPLAQIEKAEKEGAMLAAAVDGLLAFARPMRLVTAPVSLAEVIEPIASELASASGITVVSDGGDATIEGDAALLRRAFENLLRNAIESVQEKESGEVSIRITHDPHPYVEIRDSGVGIDPADVPRLLLPFQSQKASGYGLGLPLARKIVMLHGGTLTLRGSPGQGAVVVADFLMAQPVQFVT
ncbi:MAG: ATP-binding protein [Acidobacteriota bacterium]|nr:ATP-binding protein [Acidobacteriota bacterium]